MSILSLRPCMCASAALLACSSGGDVYPCQAYDRILVTANQYVISIKEDTAYLCLHFTKDHEGNKIQYAISRNDQYVIFKPYGNKIFWKISNMVPTIRNPQYAISKTLDTQEEEEQKRSCNSASAKEPVEEPIAEVIMDDAGDDVVRDDDQPQAASITPTSRLRIKMCFNALTNKLDWNNPKRDLYPFDLSNPLPLQGPLGHRTVNADYFFNNDLEYLKTSDPEVTYTTSITKTKVARYEIKRIEDMVSKFSKQNVYSTKEILGVKSVSVKKLHRYGHLEEIIVKRSDPQLYKFKEGDFVDLHLNDIKDMLFLAVQHKLFHLDGSDIVDFIVALRMFTRSLILKRRVEDLQLGVESYQKKLNITKPQKTFHEIEFKEPYTPSYDPPGIVYEDLDKQKRVLRADELYKFSDGTLKSVRDKIHHRVLDFLLDYNTEKPKRKWTAVDRKRLGLMIELIDKQLREREIIRNLERLVGARELEMDYKLMTCTRQSVKAKELQERCIIKAFKLSYQEKYEHVGPEVTRSQEGNRSQDDDYRLCLVDDLKKFKITFMSSQRYKSKPEVYNHYINSQVKD
ncbi:hypothetical protein Tco_1491301 [Tanacetum coccineum]